MSTVKVIFCTDGIFPEAVGGMQRHSRLLIEAIAESGQVELVVVHPHDKFLFTHLPGIKEHRVKAIDTSKNYLLECYRYSKRVYEVVKEYPQHIIYSQGLSVWYNVDKVKDRLIINPHGLEAYQGLTLKDILIGFPFRRIFSRLFRKANRVVSLGGKLTSIIGNILNSDSEKIVELPNAINLPSPFNVNEKGNGTALQMLFVARFARNKGLHILLDAIKQLNDEGYVDKITYNLGGTGPLFEYYTTHYKFPNVNYLGFISDEQLDQLYRTNNVFVFPTLFEGMPTVVLEAMSYGMPVIVSDTGATAVLVNKDNGYLIPKNNVEALKNAIKDYYRLSSQERAKLSENSLKRVQEKFTWNRVAMQHITCFREMHIKS